MPRFRNIKFILICLFPYVEICTDEAKAMVSKMLAPYQEYKVVAPKGTSNNYIHYYK